MAYSRSRRRPTRSRRGRPAQEEDFFSGILLWQVCICGMLVGLLHYGQLAGDPASLAAAALLQEQLDRPAAQVFAPVARELEEQLPFHFDYSGQFFSSFLPTAETDLPQGGQFFVAGSKKEKHLPPDGASFAPVAISMAVRPPLSGTITSRYGYREHPVTGMLDFHTGIDIAAPMGTTIRAALPGRAEEVGESPIYGNYIVLRHSTGLTTRYCHCSAILVGTGTNLRQGEAIAQVGSTGVSTGPHLHFEVQVDGLLRDPVGVLEGVREVER